MPLVGLQTYTAKLILNLADRITGLIIRNEEGQEGGVLCVATLESGLPLFTCTFGLLPEEEVREYTEFAQEKAARLAKNSNHWTSWQSRDMDITPKRYGGAVRTSEYILSFSGFKEEQDEATMLVLAVGIGMLPGGAAALMAQVSNNRYFRKLENACLDGNNNPLERFRFAVEKKQ